MKSFNLIIILASLFLFSQKSFSQFDLLNEHKSLYSKNKYIYNSDNLLSTYRFDEGETKYFYNSDNLLTHSKTYGHYGTSDETFLKYFDNELISKEKNIFYEEDSVAFTLIYEFSYEFYK